MKIIEALKELPLIDKKILRNTELIQKYSSEMIAGENYQYVFGSADKQREEVKSLLQSTDDLIARKAKIRRALAITNANVSVTIHGVTRTISEWIEYRQKGIDLQIKALGACNLTNANQQVAAQRGRIEIAEGGIRFERFFDEKANNEATAKLLDIQAAIDPQLEIVNATTDLKEEV